MESPRDIADARLARGEITAAQHAAIVASLTASPLPPPPPPFGADSAHGPSTHQVSGPSPYSPTHSATARPTPPPLPPYTASPTPQPVLPPQLAGANRLLWIVPVAVAVIAMVGFGAWSVGSRSPDANQVPAAQPATPPAQTIATPARPSTLYTYAWSQGDAALRALIAAQAPIDGRLTLTPSTMEVRRTTLPWLRGASLVQVRSPSWQDQSLRIYYVLENNGTLSRLSGTSPPIHAMNARTPIRIDNASVAQTYLWFFTFFVRGDDGPFLIVESENDPALVNVPAQVRAGIRQHLRPASCTAADGGEFRCQATVWYSDALFSARFRIMNGGMIEMLDDTPLKTELPRLRFPI